jgi:hypothetical protein
MTTSKARAIEFHKIAAAALRAAADKHDAVVDATDAKQTKLLAAEARQLGLEAAAKSESAAATSVGTSQLAEFVTQPLPRPPAVEGPDA